MDILWQDQLPPSISPGFRDVVSGVVPLLQVAVGMMDAS